MRFMPAISCGFLVAAIVTIAPVAGALAGAMPPEYDDPAPQRISAPAIQETEPAVSQLGEPRVLMPKPAVAIETPPPPPSALTVTYAEAVGLFSRYGYEEVKKDASLYCAQYGRVAALDSRFEVGNEWFVRFDCISPQ